jgi:peptidyl-dipeptidase A
MSKASQQFNRREFLYNSAIVAAGGALGISEAGLAEGASIRAGLAVTPEEQAAQFLEQFVRGWLPLQTAAEEANWAASTNVSEAHTARQVAKNLEVNRFVGSPQVIETVQALLKHKESLRDETVRQLEKIRLRAAEAPGTVPLVVKARAEAEAKQSAVQDGFAFTLHRPGKNPTVSANDIDRILVESRDLEEREMTLRGRWVSTTSSLSRLPITG